MTSANVTKPVTGVYCFDNLPFTVRQAMVSGVNTFGANFTLATVDFSIGGNLLDCPSSAEVRVRTVAVPSGAAYAALADRAFTIWFED